MVFPDSDLPIIVQAYLGADPTADPGTWPAPVDLSSRLLRRDIQIRRGRGKNQKTASAGACTLWLDNTDGALTPLLATSTYYPDWDLGVPLRVSVDNVGTSPPYVRHAGFVADISAVMVPGTGGQNFSVVKVTSAGVLRRISQGAVAKSALKRTITGLNTAVPAAYWSLEDGSDATQFGSGLAGGPALLATNTEYVNPTSVSASPGSAPYAEFVAQANESGGGVGSVSLTGLGLDATQFSVSLVMTGFMPTPAVTTMWRLFAIRTSSGATCFVNAFCATSGGVVGTNYGIDVWFDGGTGARAFSFGSINPFDGQPHVLVATWAQDGADVDVSMTLDGVAGTADTETGQTLGTPVSLEGPSPRALIFGDTGDNTGGSIGLGHLAVWGNVTPTDTYDAARGYASEQAHVRFARLCAEEGIPYSGTATQSVECGPQPIADVIAVLQDAEMVDHGMLIEDFAFGLNYRASSQRENLTPFMTVDLSTYRTTEGTQADVLTPVRNDARIRNEWTISRPDGATKTAKDETHQAKHGRYNDSATVNVESDDRILDEAGWRLAEGIRDGLAYNTVPLDLAANE